jgi:hypothetical protein
LGIRVDNPDDVFRLQELGPPGGASAAGWKSEGNAHFVAKEYDDAVWCYSRALAEAEGAGGGGPLLCNLAAAWATAAEGAAANDEVTVESLNVESLGFALAAFCVGPGVGKASFRLRGALSAQGGDLAAAYVSRRAVQSGWPGAKQTASKSSSSTEATSLDDLVRIVACLGVSGLGDLTVKHAADTPPLPEPSAPASGTLTLNQQRCADESLRLAGNGYFRSGDMENARVSYVRALDPVRHDLGVLLSNRAESRLRGGRSTDSADDIGETGAPEAALALLDATAAVVLCPGVAKGHHRRTRALLRLSTSAGSDNEMRGLFARCSEQSCRIGIQACPQEDFVELLASTREAVKTASRGRRHLQEYTSKTPTEREQHAAYEKSKGSMGVDDHSSTNAMMELLAAGGGPSVINIDVPTFHTEFAQLGNLPIGVDKEASRRHVLSIYECARSLPMLNMQLFDRIGVVMNDKKKGRIAAMNGYEGFVGEHALAQRLHLPQVSGTLDENEALVEWWRSAPRGHICRMFSSNGYASTVHHSFSNVAHRSEALTWDKTHVAVGFVDLGGLLFANMVGERAAAEGSLRWVGYEQSAYAVAKTLVITEMMRTGDVDARSIVQVKLTP